MLAAADVVGLSIVRRVRRQRLRQRGEIAGVLQPTAPDPALRPAQSLHRGLVGNVPMSPPLSPVKVVEVAGGLRQLLFEPAALNRW
jgi:hypothetical protein